MREVGCMHGEGVACILCMRISRVRACTYNLYTHELIYTCVMLPTGVEEITHTHKLCWIQLNNGSSLPVEGLEMNDV